MSHSPVKLVGVTIYLPLQQLYAALDGMENKTDS